MMFYVLMGLVVLCVSGLIFGATMLIRGDADQIEDRLQSLTKNGGRGVAKQSAIQGSVLKSPLDDVPNALEEFANKFLNLRKWIEQSGLKLTQSNFCIISVGLGFLFAAVYMFFLFCLKNIQH